MSKYIIFDFNGTIIDDVDLCVKLLNDILKSQNKKQVTVKEYKDIFTFPIKKYYELAGVDFELESFDSLAEKFIKAYQPASLRCSLYPKSIETFEELRKKGYHLLILSASEKQNLLEQCNAFKLVSYFDAILGIDNIHAESKVGIALKYMEDHHIKGKDVLMVGDTLHDAEVAKAIQSDCVFVSCGHQSEQVLKQGKKRILPSISSLIEFLNES